MHHVTGRCALGCQCCVNTHPLLLLQATLLLACLLVRAFKNGACGNTETQTPQGLYMSWMTVLVLGHWATHPLGGGPAVGSVPSPQAGKPPRAEAGP